MARRKGDLTRNIIKREHPHQVILPTRMCTGSNLDIHTEFCRDLSTSPRTLSVVESDE
jgi:hypothetical protein